MDWSKLRALGWQPTHDFGHEEDRGHDERNPKRAGHLRVRLFAVVHLRAVVKRKFDRLIGVVTDAELALIENSVKAIFGLT